MTLGVPRGTGRTVMFGPANAGSGPTPIIVTGTSGIPGKFVVRYFLGGEEITPQVTSGMFRCDDLAPGTYLPIKVYVSAKSLVGAGRIHEIRLTVSSPTDPSAHDTCKLRVRVQ